MVWKEEGVEREGERKRDKERRGVAYRLFVLWRDGKGKRGER